jgi:hypothetical protein
VQVLAGNSATPVACKYLQAIAPHLSRAAAVCMSASPSQAAWCDPNMQTSSGQQTGLQQAMASSIVYFMLGAVARRYVVTCKPQPEALAAVLYVEFGCCRAAAAGWSTSLATLGARMSGATLPVSAAGLCCWRQEKCCCWRLCIARAPAGLHVCR